MPNTYSKQVIEAFKDKLETIKKYEEKNIKIENSQGLEHPSSSRQFFVSAYEHVLEMLDEHFKLIDEQPAVQAKPSTSKRKGGAGRPKGSRNKPKEETTQPEERLRDEP